MRNEFLNKNKQSCWTITDQNQEIIIALKLRSESALTAENLLPNDMKHCWFRRIERKYNISLESDTIQWFTC